jgi:folate-dependent phosphoribosylglycinamide formyltransferase PurN
VRIVILCQEEPVFLGPFLREVIRRAPHRIQSVVIAGRRSAGERRGTLAETLRSLCVFWLVLEPAGFLDALWRRARSSLLGSWDPGSVEGLARALAIPVLHLASNRAAEVLPIIRELAPDVVLNQSEILLDAEILSVPRRGFLNRHASLLPAHRGRLGSFWAHADERPLHGVTIHLVDEGIDTGEILVQWEAPSVDPRWPFPKVLRYLNEQAPALFWEAIDRLERGEAPVRQRPGGGRPPARFPTLEEARRYRAVLEGRRAER